MTRIFEGSPITGVVGLNGVGKTLLAASHAVEQLEAGRTVYSTVPLRTASGIRSTPITSLGQLLRMRDALILLDEVSVILPGGNTGTLPSEVDTLLQTLRHKGNSLIWTAPTWMRPHLRLREVTQAVVSVFPLVRKPARDPWVRPLVIGASLLDASSGRVDEVPTRVRRRAVYVPTRLAGWGAYDTHADTPIIGRHLAGGRCPDCGGSRTVPPHSKERHEELGLPWYDEDAEQRRVAGLEALHGDTVTENAEGAALPPPLG